MADMKQASQQVQDAAADLSLEIKVLTMADSTRTAEDAAAACDCTVGQIVKSLVFRGAESGDPVLLLVSGSNRVNEKKAGQFIGEKLSRPDATYVREATGFAIGGIPPFAPARPLTTYIDRDLLQYDVVWAAAGTPNSVFSVEPNALAQATGATVVDVT